MELDCLTARANSDGLARFGKRPINVQLRGMWLRSQPLVLDKKCGARQFLAEGVGWAAAEDGKGRTYGHSD